MASTDALPFPRKGVAYRVTFPIYDADGDLVAGAAGLDSEVSKDGGTFVDCTNEATQIATSSGVYFLDLTATEMDADTVAIIVKTTTTGAKTTVIVLYPIEDEDIRANVVRMADGVITAAKFATDAINAAALATDAVAEIADAVLDRVVDGTRTLRQLARGWTAALLGKVSGMGANAPVFRNIADDKNVISATTDDDGNRTAVSLDLS